MSVTISGSGQIIKQVVQTASTTAVTTTSTSYVNATGYSASITPTNSSNKVLVSLSAAAGTGPTYSMWVQITRNGTAIAYFPVYGGQPANPTYTPLPITINFLDSPATVSAVTYQVQFRSDNGAGTSTFGGAPSGAYSQGTAVWTNTLTVSEVAYA